MRVALLTHQWPGVRLGGIGTCVRHAAAALVSAGHEAHVFTLTLDAQSRQTFPSGAHLHEVPTLAERVQNGTLAPSLAAAIQTGGEGSYRLSIGWLLTAAFKESHQNNPFDIVEVPDVEALGLPILLDSGRDLPVVTHLHCCTAIAHDANGTVVGLSEKLIQSLEFAAIHLADGLCAATQAVVDATRSFVPIDRQPAMIPYPFVTGDQPFAPPPAGGPILFQGRLEWLKGCAVITEALNPFLKRNPNARFHFIGPDTATAPGGRSMRRHILDNLSPAIADRVKILGEISREQVDEEIKSCSFFVQPSLRENFSLVCCEAMAAGRTVIVGGGTGSVELVGDAGIAISTGSVGELAREMESLYRNRIRLEELSQHAYNRIRLLCDPVSVTRERVKFYQDTIGQFRQHTKNQSRLETLPPKIAGALLPALSQITAALSGISQSQSPGVRLREIFGKINSDSAAVILYGAGKHTTRLMADRHTWEQHGHRVVGVIDDHPRFADEKTFLSLPVRSLMAAEQAVRAGQTLPAVVLSTDTYEDQFWENTAGLRQLGVPVFRLYGQKQSA